MTVSGEVSSEQQTGAVRGIALAVTETVPTRARARRDITGKSPDGFEVRAVAYADPIPDSLDWGPFYGEGKFEIVRRGYMVVTNLEYAEIPEIIAILQEVLATTPTVAALTAKGSSDGV